MPDFRPQDCKLLLLFDYPSNDLTQQSEIRSAPRHLCANKDAALDWVAAFKKLKWHSELRLAAPSRKPNAARNRDPLTRLCQIGTREPKLT